MLISVIIPTYNRIHFIKKAVKSVLMQDAEGFNIEVIIVNDGDISDSTILNEMFKYNLNIRIFNNDGEGVASARNYGVSKALGEYVTFLDDDDIYLPGRLQSFFENINDEYILLSSGRIEEIGDFEVINIINQKFGKITLDDIKYENSIDIGFMIRREIFLELDGFDVTLSKLEDWDFII